jgi:hypothetical protein
MHPITAPITPDSRKQDITNLQEALLVLLEKHIIPVDPQNTIFFGEHLLVEQHAQLYGDVTTQLVSFFQSQRQLNPDGLVNDATADALNGALHQIGALDGEATPGTFVVCGQVLRRDGVPLPGIRVRASHETHASERDSIRLGDDITDAEGRYTIRYESLPGLAGLHLRVVALADDDLPLETIDLPHPANPVEVVNLAVAATEQPGPRRIDGRVMFDDGRAAAQLTLRLYRRQFGGGAQLLRETVTLDEGIYSLPYELAGQAASLEIRSPKDATDEIALCTPLNDLPEHAIVNLVAPGSLHPPAAEYQRLAADLTPHVAQIAELAAAQENQARQDLTVLNRATGWDARLVGMAAIAHRLSADEQVALPPEALYGLLRAGLPSDKLQLAQLEPDLIEQTLKTVRDAGIVALDDAQVASVKQQFAVMRDQIRLDLRAPGSSASYGRLLQSSGIGADAQTKFAGIYLGHEGSPTELWAKAEQAGLRGPEIRSLQLQGKLAFLAGNGEGMTAGLMQKKTVDGQPLSDPVQLVEQGLYRVEAWKTELFDQAGIPAERRDNLNDDDRQSLNALIPLAYGGEKAEERLDAYAEDMARKLRLAYPTQVLMHQIENQDAFKPLAGGTQAIPLLKNAVAQGFRLGATPFASFLQGHEGVARGIDGAALPAAQQQVDTLHRLYQITNSNEAIPVMMDMGITSAYELTGFTKGEYIGHYNRKYHELFNKPPAPGEPEKHFLRAHQVSSMIYNLVTVAKKLSSDVSLAGFGAAPAARQQSLGELIKHYPTMESLFGSMDFCECEHCNSVLSPAAYLVDLLQFVDTESAKWASFLGEWARRHPGQPYQPLWTAKPDGSARTEDERKPYDALIERRPDLPYIPLSCENTNTTLPYIDIVNEILEYYVANGKLAEQAARDTGGASTAELLAEPQYVIRQAYDKLLEARYPLNLPFDLWVETAREFSNFFDTPLHQLAASLRKPAGPPAPSQSIDHVAAELIESLGLAPAEFALFADPDPLARWYELYGYRAERAPIHNPGVEVSGSVQNATLSIPDADAAAFAQGALTTYFDASADRLHDQAKTIKAIGAPGSGGAAQTKVTFDGIWNSAPEANDKLVFDAPATLQSAKALARRLGLSYRELAQLLQTGFVNPELVKLALLHKLGVRIEDGRRFKEHKSFFEQHRSLLDAERKDLASADQLRFDALTKAVPGTAMTGWDIVKELAAFRDRLTVLAADFATPVTVLETSLEAIPFNKILVLQDADAGCSFDHTVLRYADGTPAQPIDYVRLNLFVRLWRKLGWSMEETDRALDVFILKAAPFDATPAPAARAPLLTALFYLAHLKALVDQLGLGKQGRIALTTLWSDLPTTGARPLYAQLFLSESMRQSDPAFDHPLGATFYLSAPVIADLAERTHYRAYRERVVPADQLNPALFALRPTLQVRYDSLHEVQHLSFEGVLSDADRTALAALQPGSQVLAELLGDVHAQGVAFPLLRGHLATLQGALGLTADEIALILADAGSALEHAPLSLANVSLLYRYGLLANALKLPVRELIALKQLSNVDPFTPLDPEPLTTIGQDHPLSQTLRFVSMVDDLRASGLSTEDLDYLLRHRFDPTGKYRPDGAGVRAMLKALADGIRAIRVEHAVPADPGELVEEVLRQKLGLALPAAVVDRFLALFNGTAECTVSLAVAAGDQLASADVGAEVAIGRVLYDGVRQTLILRGLLSAPQKSAILDRLGRKLPPGQRTALAALLDAAQGAAREQAQAFFDTELLKHKLNPAATSGFLEAADFALLFGPPAAGQTEQQHLREQRTHLAQAFLPYLQQRLIRQLVVRTLTSHTAADPLLAESLLTNSSLLALGGAPLVQVFAAAADRADAADVFGPGDTVFSAYLTVPASGPYRFFIELERKDAAAELHFDHLPEQVFLKGSAARDGAVLGDSAPSLALQSGMLYRCALRLTGLGGGTAQLMVQGESLTRGPLSRLTLYGAAPMDAAERALLVLGKTLQLAQALTLGEREMRYLLTHAARFGNLQLATLPWRDAQAALGQLAQARQKADPTLIAAQALAQARTEQPVLAAETDLVTPHFEQFLRLAAYARLKRDLAAGTDDLIGILEAGESADPDRLDKKIYPLIATLTRRDERTVKATANALFGAPAFDSEQPLAALWTALQVVGRFGVPVDALLDWTAILGPGASAERRYGIARGLKQALKARFDAEAWRRVAQPIADRLRQRQRDALVAHIMHQRGFGSVEELYEYFLIDPGMEPVVQTSRIRLAIGSLQLFIQRCLLNLEPRVLPSLIVASEWEWMKRYRLWEANRKIFLFPENWLEPEFRDDKTHLYTELEATLLQADVSSDVVEKAFLTYLKQLDELARLDIIAMHIEDGDPPRTLHVFGRTFSHPAKYFYRRYANRMWTPWEPVKADIEGRHLAPVVWRDRLYLFWVTFLEKPEQPGERESLQIIGKANSGAVARAMPSLVLSGTGGASAPPPPPPSKETLADMPLTEAREMLRSPVARTVEAHLHWSEYLDGEWSTRESSDLAAPSPLRITGHYGFGGASVRLHVSRKVDPDGTELGVYIHLSAPFNAAFVLASRNSQPEWAPYDSASRPDSPYTAAGGLAVTFRGTISTEPGKTVTNASAPILSRTDGYGLLLCDNKLMLSPSPDALAGAERPEEVKAALKESLGEVASLMQPAFFTDAGHTLFVEPAVTETTTEKWEEWIPPAPQPRLTDRVPLDAIVVNPMTPYRLAPKALVPDGGAGIDPHSLIGPRVQDWLVNSGTVLAFGDVLLGPTGPVGRLASDGIDGKPLSGAGVETNPVGLVQRGASIVLSAGATLAQAGLTQFAGAINVIGSDGFNTALQRNFTESIRPGALSRAPATGLADH